MEINGFGARKNGGYHRAGRGRVGVSNGGRLRWDRINISAAQSLYLVPSPKGIFLKESTLHTGYAFVWLCSFTFAHDNDRSNYTVYSNMLVGKMREGKTNSLDPNVLNKGNIKRMVGSIFLHKTLNETA
jgi:hypothetical protein